MKERHLRVTHGTGTAERCSRDGSKIMFLDHDEALTQALHSSTAYGIAFRVVGCSARRGVWHLTRAQKGARSVPDPFDRADPDALCRLCRQGECPDKCMHGRAPGDEFNH